MKKKLIREENLKSCEVQIVAKRYARNPESFKTESAYFSVIGTFKIDPNKRYRNWSLVKIVRPFKMSFMRESGMKTVIALFDGQQTTILKPTQKMQFGVDFETTEPKRITMKEAKELLDSGAYLCELSGDTDLTSLPIAKFSK